jgi:hypothetical protein
MRSKKIASVVLASVGIGGLSVVLGAGGCTLVVDSGGYQVVLEDGSADSTIGVDTGAGGMDSGVDTGLPGSDTGAPSEDTGVGPAEDAGDSGPACGSTLATSSPTFEQILLSCVLDQGCQNSSYSFSVSTCVAESELASISAVTACESHAQTCTDISDCTGQGWTGSCNTGSSTQTASTCDAQNRINYCSGSGDEGWFWDCTKNGGTCETYIDPNDLDAGVVAGCVVVSSCSNADDGTEYCSGSDLYQCVNKKDGGAFGVGQDCNNFSATCESSGDSGTSCYYDLPACTAATTTACQGDIGQICYSTGLQTYNCAAAGLTCSPVSNSVTGLPFTCVAPGCDPSNCTETCGGSSGNVATFCVGGAPVTFDCSTLGMNCYDSDVEDSNGNSLVYCLPF